MENVEKFVFMLFCFQKQRKQPEITSSACLKILYVQTLLKMPFSSEQEKLIILLFGRFQSSTQVRREFIKHKNLKGPACSPDLNPLDYYFWGMASYEVYQTNPETLLDVMEAVTAVCAIVGSPQVKKSVRNIRKRLEKCAQQDGGHFQHLVK